MTHFACFHLCIKNLNIIGVRVPYIKYREDAEIVCILLQSTVHCRDDGDELSHTKTNRRYVHTHLHAYKYRKYYYDHKVYTCSITG